MSSDTEEIDRRAQEVIRGVLDRQAVKPTPVLKAFLSWFVHNPKAEYRPFTIIEGELED